MTNEYRDPGHPVLDPTGNAIRLPQQAIVKLRRLGLLQKRRGIPQISTAIYPLMTSEYDGLTDGLRRLLGEDCTEPNGWYAVAGNASGHRETERENDSCSTDILRTKKR